MSNYTYPLHNVEPIAKRSITVDNLILNIGQTVVCLCKCCLEILLFGRNRMKTFPVLEQYAELK